MVNTHIITAKGNVSMFALSTAAMTTVMMVVVTLCWALPGALWMCPNLNPECLHALRNST